MCLLNVRHYMLNKPRTHHTQLSTSTNPNNRNINNGKYNSHKNTHQTSFAPQSSSSGGSTHGSTHVDNYTITTAITRTKTTTKTPMTTPTTPPIEQHNSHQHKLTLASRDSQRRKPTQYPNQQHPKLHLNVRGPWNVCTREPTARMCTNKPQAENHRVLRVVYTGQGANLVA